MARKAGVNLTGLVAGALLAGSIAWAAGGLTVQHPWVTATVPGQPVAGAYMELISPTDAAVVAVSSPVAGSAEIHSMSMEGGVMKMRGLKKLVLPAKKTVKLGPGGYHIMLMDLKAPLKKGATVPITLTIEGKDKSTSTVEIKAEVREIVGGMH